MNRSQLILAGVRVLGGALLACSVSCGQASGDGASGARDLLGLQLTPGVSITNAVYTISGPNGFFSAGSVDVGDSADVSVVIGHVPVGSGYELDLTATASDGQTICDGSTLFDVAVDKPSTTVSVHLVCAVPTGDVQVNATLNICPQIDELNASPTDVRVGGVVALTGSAHDTDNGPSPLSYKWSINGVPLKQVLPPILNFVCSSLGTFNFALSASDGDITPGCADTQSVTARCTAP